MGADRIEINYSEPCSNTPDKPNLSLGCTHLTFWALETQADDQQGQYEKKQGQYRIFPYWPCLFRSGPVCHLYEAGCFGYVNAILP